MVKGNDKSGLVTDILSKLINRGSFTKLNSISVLESEPYIFTVFTDFIFVVETRLLWVKETEVSRW